MEEKQKLRNVKGITLIALVVTIIVLIILAGVSISLVLGENGIITKSKYAKQETLNAQVAEQEQLNEATSYLEDVGENAVEPPVEDSKQNITFTYNPPLNEWTKGEVVVTANTDIEGYTIQTSTNGENWESTNIQKYSENGKVYAKLVKDDVQQGNIVEGEVTNIDKINPEVGSIMFKLKGEEEWIDQNEWEDLWTPIEAFVKLVDGKDFESGHKSTTYSIIGSYDFYYYPEAAEGDLEEETEEVNVSGEYVIYENIKEEVDLEECLSLLEQEIETKHGVSYWDSAGGMLYLDVEIITEDFMGNISRKQDEIYWMGE